MLFIGKQTLCISLNHEHIAKSPSLVKPFASLLEFLRSFPGKTSGNLPSVILWIKTALRNILRQVHFTYI